MPHAVLQNFQGEVCAGAAVIGILAVVLNFICDTVFGQIEFGDAKLKKIRKFPIALFGNAPLVGCFVTWVSAGTAKTQTHQKDKEKYPLFYVASSFLGGSSVQRVYKLFHGIDDVSGTGIFHIRHFAVAPGNADGGNAMSGGANDIKGSVAYHDGLSYLSG